MPENAGTQTRGARVLLGAAVNPRPARAVAAVPPAAPRLPRRRRCECSRGHVPLPVMVARGCRLSDTSQGVAENRV
eukprot:2899751-Alexandrium_andersonii.AAC.1